MSKAEPNESDWLKIGNDIRRVLNDVHERIDGTRPYKLEKVGRLPTQAELDAWENACPGSVEKLKAMAHREMHHRMHMKDMNKKITKVKKLFYYLFIWIMLPTFILGFT